MATVGFDAAMVGVLDDNEKVDPNKIYVFDKSGGGVVEGALTGLAPTQNVVYASNVPFYVSSKGTGTPTLALTVGDKEDLPSDALVDILGWQKDEDTQIVSVGQDSEAPYCAVILLTKDAAGKVLYISMLKGRFSFDGDDIVTTDDNGATLSSDVLNGTFIARKSDGLVYSKGRESDGMTQEVFQAFVFPEPDDSGGGNGGGSGGGTDDAKTASKRVSSVEQATAS